MGTAPCRPQDHGGSKDEAWKEKWALLYTSSQLRNLAAATIAARRLPTIPKRTIVRRTMEVLNRPILGSLFH
jgi:hypothetical protein